MRTPAAITALVALVGLTAACWGSGGGPARASAAYAAAGPAARSAIDAAFRKAIGDDEPGCVASAAIAGTTFFSKAYGLADIVSEAPLTAASTFDIASVSKQFTAAAIYLLAADDELALDDDIHDYAPELPNYGEALTIDDLIHHTSGLADYTDLLAERFDDTDRTTEKQALATLRKVRKLTFKPGRRFEYNNSNYFLLGLVVKRVSHQSLGAFLHDRIFAPLGMTHSVVRDRASLRVPHGASGHETVDGGFGAGTTNWEQVGDGAIWTTVDDLQRWAVNLVSWKVGGPALKAAMLKPGRVLDDGDRYGGGLYLLDAGELHHSGAWAGFTSEFVVRPADRLSVVVLCNRDDVDTADLADAIVGAVT